MDSVTPPPEQELPAPHLDEDRILDLLLDLLPDAELKEAGRHLASCERCEDLLRRRGALLERRRASQKPATMLGLHPAPDQSRLQHSESETSGASLGAARTRIRSAGDWLEDASRWVASAVRRPRFALGLGGAVFVAIGLLLLTANPTRTISYPTSAEWLPSAAETLSLRSDSGRTRGADLSAALTAYDRRDLPTAIQTFSAAEASGSMETMRLVYLGSSLTHAGEYRRAVQVLQSISLGKLPEPWRGESYWTLLVALHGAGDDDAADSLLRSLTDQPGGIGARARRLLGRPDP